MSIGIGTMVRRRIRYAFWTIAKRVPGYLNCLCTVFQNGLEFKAQFWMPFNQVPQMPERSIIKCIGLGCLHITTAGFRISSLALKRSMFKVTMQDLMREVYGLPLRIDVPDALGKQQEAWKGVRLLEAEALAG